MKSVLVNQPHYGTIVPASLDALRGCAEGLDDWEVVTTRFASSLLCFGFNKGVAVAKNRGSDFYALLHADVEPQPGWLAALLDDMDRHDLDVTHAPCAIKSVDGLTSTAIVESDSLDAPRRRLTIREIRRLPDVFTVDDVRETLAPDAKILLPNTGCIVMRCGEWFEEWQGFHMRDRVVRQGGEWDAKVVPEDWMFGFDAYRMGLRVGCSRHVLTNHHGPMKFATSGDWGKETDENYIRLTSEGVSA